MQIGQGEIWWADLGEPLGAAPGYRRPVVVGQANAINESRIATVVCVALTSNLRWADSPGNLLLKRRLTGLDKDPVANVSMIVTVDKSQLTERLGKLSQRQLTLLFSGIDLILGR